MLEETKVNKRTTYSSELKAKLAVKLISSEETIAELSDKYNWTTLYYKLREVPESELKIKHRIDEINTFRH